MINLPAAFRDQMQEILPDTFQAFAQSLEATLPVSIHYNPLKPVTKFSETRPIPWYEGGAYLPQRPSFTLDPVFHAGAYYVQEASSMLVAAAFRKCFPDGRPLRVLDLCAAPGGKSTLLTAQLPPGSWLLANEVIRSRYQILRYNLSKWGYPNTFTSNHDVADFAGLRHFFDLVLVDAPCSGEGLFRKDEAARSEWSADHVRLCAARQGRILESAASLVAPGGVLLYSTCTYNRQENDANAQWLATDSGLRYEHLEFPAQWGLEKRKHGYQAYPHRVEGEGFFIAAFRQDEAIAKPKIKAHRFKKLQPLGAKDQAVLSPWINAADEFRYYSSAKGNWRAISKPLVADAELLASHLTRLEVGTVVGEQKGKTLIPSAEWALHTQCSTELLSIETNRETALEFLRKNTPPIPALPKGWVRICHQGLGLGWVKGLGNRYNNYYPKNWRIRMRG